MLPAIEFNTLRGAYGRDYDSKTKVLEDWIAGKDFCSMLSGRYCSIRNFTSDVNVRYKGNTREVKLRYRKADGTWYV